jgi:uncharacterized protein (DUF433 family)
MLVSRTTRTVSSFHKDSGTSVVDCFSGYNLNMTSWEDHLSRDPAVCGGSLCARSTRVSVTVILDNLAAGLSRAEVIESYPTLRPEHIEAALSYAAELAREEQLIPLMAR